MSILLFILLAVGTATAEPYAFDPPTLDEAAAQVRLMNEQGASNDELGRYVAGVVDRRITNGNTAEGLWFRGLRTGSPGMITHRRFIRESEEITYIAPQYIERAEWAWNLGYGQCAEVAAIQYYIFREAGIPARHAEVEGHAFTIIGLAPNASIGNYMTWGANARVVDGWQRNSFTAAALQNQHGYDHLDLIQMAQADRPVTGGGVFTPEEARNNYWIGNAGQRRVIDSTNTMDNPGARRYMERGVLRVKVVAADGRPLLGATITAAGPETRTGVATARTAGDVAFDTMLPGFYSVTATPPPGSAGAPVNTSVFIEARRVARLQLAIGVRPAQLQVLVLDESGKPVTGATVTCANQSAVTPADGSVTLTVPSGSHTVGAHRDGFHPATASLNISPTGATATLRLQPAHVLCSIRVGSGGDWLNGAAVSLDGGGRSYTGYTDDAGWALLTAPPGTYRVTAAATFGSASEQLVAEPVNGGSTVVFIEPGEVNSNALMPLLTDGDERPDALPVPVTVRVGGGNGWRAGATVTLQAQSTVFTATTDRAGWARFTVPAASRWRATATATGFKTGSEMVEAKPVSGGSIVITLEPEPVRPAAADDGYLSGEGSVPLPPEVSGSARVIFHEAALNVRLTIDLHSGELNGSAWGESRTDLETTGPGERRRETVRSSLTGPVTGRYTGNRTAGTFTGTANLAISINGGRATTVPAQVSGSVVNGEMICKVSAGEEITLRFPARYRPRN